MCRAFFSCILVSVISGAELNVKICNKESALIPLASGAARLRCRVFLLLVFFLASFLLILKMPLFIKYADDFTVRVALLKASSNIHLLRLRDSFLSLVGAARLSGE